MFDQCAVDHPTLQSTSVFHTSTKSWWNATPFYGNAEPQSRKNGPPSIWDTHGISGNVQIQQNNTSPHVMCENQTPVQDQRCQSGPSASNSVIQCEGFFKELWDRPTTIADSDHHFDRFTTLATFWWKKKFKSKVCNYSQFLTEAL